MENNLINKDGGQKPLKMNIDLNSAEDVICPYCEEHKMADEPSQNIFIQAHIIKKISAFNSPTGKEMFVPVPIFICQVCGLQVVGSEKS